MSGVQKSENDLEDYALRVRHLRIIRQVCIMKYTTFVNSLLEALPVC